MQPEKLLKEFVLFINSIKQGKFPWAKSNIKRILLTKGVAINNDIKSPTEKYLTLNKEGELCIETLSLLFWFDKEILFVDEKISCKEEEAIKIITTSSDISEERLLFILHHINEGAKPPIWYPISSLNFVGLFFGY